MSNYYDPWAHAIQLFMQRVMQFLVLTMLLGLAVWLALMGWYFPQSTWGDLARWSWEVTAHGSHHWRTVFVVCLVVGAVLSGWLFTTIVLLSRLRSGDRYHRGSRVVQHHEQD